MIRAAIVGIGRWGRTLVNSVQGKSSAIRFTAGHTRTRASAEAFCAERGITLRDDLDAILTDPAIDAVVFTTPHSQHAAQVERAASAGKHVLMEKPFTLDVESAEAALGAAARAGIVLGVAYPRRFHPAMIELKARVQDGRLGILTHCESAQTAPAGLFMSSEYWRSDPQEAPAGAMTATGVHNLDAMIYLFGSIDEVYCTNLRRLMPRLEEFRFAPAPEAPPTGRHAAPLPEIIEYSGFNALTAELEGFAAAIKGERSYPITPEEIIHGVAVFEAIVRSAALHQPVKVVRR